MTTPPPMPDQPPAPPAKPRRKAFTAIGIGAALALAVVGGIVIGSAGNDGRADSKSPATASATPSDSGPVEPFTGEDVAESPSYDEPTVSDFMIELKTKSKQCFGSAGCNLTVEPELTYLGDLADLDPAATFDITYEITGADDGPITETLELSNQEDVSGQTTILSTASSGDELDVEITDVTSY